MDHLKAARKELTATYGETLSPADSRLLRSMFDLLNHLEQSPPSSGVPPHRHQYWMPGFQKKLETSLPIPEQPAETESGQSSSVATWPEVGTRPTFSTSSKWSSRVSPGGTLALSVLRAISDWCNSQEIPGDVQEVVIGLTLSELDRTPPTGAALPTPQASGHAGDSRWERGVLLPSSPSPVAEQREDGI